MDQCTIGTKFCEEHLHLPKVISNLNVEGSADEIRLVTACTAVLSLMISKVKMIAPTYVIENKKSASEHILVYIFSE